jgi:hypothetical protein
MIAILTGVKWNLSVVLIYISFMARDAYTSLKMTSILPSWALTEITRTPAE